MFKVTVDLFSARPNPSWIVADADGEELLKKLESQTRLVSNQSKGYDGLGFRGIQIELLNDEISEKLPRSFSIANGLAQNQKESINIARTIVDQMLRYEKNSMEIHGITPINKEIQKIIMNYIDLYEKDIIEIRKHTKFKPVFPKELPIRTTVNDDFCKNCQYEESKFNPDFWNLDPNVRANNNCYNYARDWKTNTFAQPGRFSGHMYTALTCANIQAAAMSDGLTQRCTCLPPSEYPRRLMALVIAPGQDFHWYRKQEGGFWGHKPGSTVARNYDNSNVLVTDPRTANRGPYTDFCAFFYAGKSVMIK